MDASCIVCAGPLPPREAGKTGPKPRCCSDRCRAARENECARKQRTVRRDELNAFQRQWYAKNIDKMRARQAARSDKAKAYSRNFYLKHREELRVKNRLRTLAGGAKADYRKRVSTPEGLERERVRCREKARRFRETNPERASVVGRLHGNARRARKRNAFVESVHPATVFARGGGACGICSLPIDPTSKWHIDHIVPLSRGGEHSYANTQPAHAACNMHKGARTEYRRAS